MTDETDDRKALNEAMAHLSTIRETAGLNLKGKLYSMVKDRVEIFRRSFGTKYRIDTEISAPEGYAMGACILGIAKIMDDRGLVVASGHAMERVGATNITTTNPVEMAETSAIGRALACFGLAGGEYASGDEMMGVPRKEAAASEIQRIDREVTQRLPPQMTQTMTGLYVPSEDELLWGSPEEERKRILAELLKIEDTKTLGRYWSELTKFTEDLKHAAPMLLAELKAAFATANNKIVSRSNQI